MVKPTKWGTRDGGGAYHGGLVAGFCCYRQHSLGGHQPREDTTPEATLKEHKGPALSTTSTTSKHKGKHNSHLCASHISRITNKAGKPQAVQHRRTPGETTEHPRKRPVPETDMHAVRT